MSYCVYSDDKDDIEVFNRLCYIKCLNCNETERIQSTIVDTGFSYSEYTYVDQDGIEIKCGSCGKFFESEYGTKEDRKNFQVSCRGCGKELLITDSVVMFECDCASRK